MFCAENMIQSWRRTRRLVGGLGMGTAAFYNYIYYNITRFAENDALRSNQIRQGVMTRERALELVKQENEPRWGFLAMVCQHDRFQPQRRPPGHKRNAAALAHKQGSTCFEPLGNGYALAPI